MVEPKTERDFIDIKLTCDTCGDKQATFGVDRPSLTEDLNAIAQQLNIVHIPNHKDHNWGLTSIEITKGVLRG